MDLVQVYILVMSNSLEELVEQLDPNRDYGLRTYSDIVVGVLDGSIHAAPGHPVPMLRVDGMSIKGSGAPLALIESTKGTSPKKSWVVQFEERASTDFDAVYESLLNSALTGEVKAQMYFLDRLLGKPRESRDVGNTEMLSAFMGALAGTRMVDIEEPPRSSLRIIDPLE
jgi:hypothetical protein|tara:strand:+ start:85 stop:594 length:510 start_codon:yes stop_codon:yes gene_type:complete